MLQIERFQYIEELLNDKVHIGINELARSMNISRATIYRDLKDLELQGKIVIVRGGITKASFGKSIELPYFTKRAANSEEKQRIARAAAGFVQDKQIIFLDSSTTVNEMVPFLLEKKNLQIITNDLKNASDLTVSPEIKVFVSGGLTRPGYYTLTGSLALNNLAKMSIDVAFLSCDSINLKGGCMITNEEEVSIKQEVIARSSQVILLGDHTKFSSHAFMSFCKLDQIDQVITGKELGDAAYTNFREHGVKIVRV